ncbi:LLM class flavin-dependent oxidoreductase [Kineosporia succinea]|uniref:Alkanesulfonate monooxygenase SsuD/methylene tetrahydromethanopterin reductase-like flavin-dependent oxidoreductase (Luciferase family) n=1 Tax=Kineosporia succinea TaxID=84632 RepID=A0ABT9P2I7_9ACTN|nr:LLM class flavin-dependent oxidoreductase [Kineosporia succinea]MDP9826899.1 alkanesulfonate monooxygenase SsuD/methylene tetrahydromethanopterin reductase-like flavin-dependent oxidoreductase (luciferase family) [Kineosporia succinea]
MSLRFGLMTHAAAEWSELTTRWKGFEDNGFDALWAGDHLWSALGDNGYTQPRFDAWMIAAGIAQATSKVTVGTLVSAINMRNPAVLAKQALTLDHMSGGRAVAGIGAGGNPKDGAVAGEKPWSPAEKSERLDEYLTVVRQVAAGGELDYTGKHYSTQGVAGPTPVAPRVPLLVAAHLKSSLTVTARHADVWNSYGTLFSQLAKGIRLTPEESLSVTARRSAFLDAECERTGRDPQTLRRSFMLAFTQDTPWVSVQQFRDTIGRYAEVGVTEFMFPFPLQGQHDPDVFTEVVETVMPKLQAGERP